MDVRTLLLIKRVTSHWKSLPRKVVTASSLSELKEHLDDILSDML